jgi:hypothetical protein
MLDVFNIPGQQDNVKIFYAQSGSNSWQTWQKPRNCKFIWIMCIGGGAGGAGGYSVGLSNATAGPGGGGSGAITRALFPANTLPDTLYVQPGLGGSGGIGQIPQAYGASGAGSRSFVVINPSGSVPAAMNTVCISGAAGAASVTSATGGSAETIATTTQAGLLSLGTFISVAGQAGATSPGNITPLSSVIVSGGGAGAGCSSGGQSGGNISATTISPIISGGTSTSVKGSDGIISWKPLYFLGGAGGWGADTTVLSTGSNGGDGAYGCGGGGGSMSSAAVPGGSGGRGGDGLVIIATF